MNRIGQQLDAYIRTHSFDSGQADCETVLDYLYQAYQESHEDDPPEIREAYLKLDAFFNTLSLDQNNDCFSLISQLCFEFEHKAFIDGVQYGAHLMREVLAP